MSKLHSAFMAASLLGIGQQYSPFYNHSQYFQSPEALEVDKKLRLAASIDGPMRGKRSEERMARRMAKREAQRAKSKP